MELPLFLLQLEPGVVKIEKYFHPTSVKRFIGRSKLFWFWLSLGQEMGQNYSK